MSCITQLARPGCAQGQKLSAKEERELACKRQVYELANSGCCCTH